VPPQPPGDLTPQERIAARLESELARQGRSLTDPTAVTDLLVVLGEVRIILRGALETGIIQPDQHQALDGMYEAMESAPSLLA